MSATERFSAAGSISCCLCFSPLGFDFFSDPLPVARFFEEHDSKAVTMRDALKALLQEEEVREKRRDPVADVPVSPRFQWLPVATTSVQWMLLVAHGLTVLAACLSAGGRWTSRPRGGR